MVYNQANNTFVQTMPDGTVQTFGGLPTRMLTRRPAPTTSDY